VIARLILLLVFSLSWLPAPSAWAAAAAPQLPRVRIAYSSISSIFAGLWVAKEAGVFENMVCAVSCSISAQEALPFRR
jgi:ABC-type nitrate/sulfonate/bicarbonate transport system substrate-binding protein